MLGSKKYDIVYSIGEDCACALFMRKNKIRDCSGPFDWITKAPFISRIDMIENGFKDFLNPKYLQKLKKTIAVTNDAHDYYENTKTKFYFYHD